MHLPFVVQAIHSLELNMITNEALRERMAATGERSAGWLWMACNKYVIGGTPVAFVCCGSLLKLCAGAEMGCAFAGWGGGGLGDTKTILVPASYQRATYFDL